MLDELMLQKQMLDSISIGFKKISHNYSCFFAVLESILTSTNFAIRIQSCNSTLTVPFVICNRYAISNDFLNDDLVYQIHDK